MFYNNTERLMLNSKKIFISYSMKDTLGMSEHTSGQMVSHITTGKKMPSNVWNTV